MKHVLLSAVFVAPGYGVCLAQAPTDSGPARTNVLGAEYPRVTEGPRAVFQFKAAGAQRVETDITGTRYVYLESPGTAHERLTWRRDLKDFAPRLFKQ